MAPPEAVLLPFLAAGFMFVFMIAIAVYFYAALAWYTIAKKLKYRIPWLAWIPIANISLVLQMGGFHWAWVFLILIPILGWIALAALAIIATWRIFEMREYPGWFSLAPILPYVGGLLYLIAIGFIAWADKGGERYVTPIKSRPKKKKYKRKK